LDFRSAGAHIAALREEEIRMKINALGHVVLRVTDRERSERFYNGILGLPICARFDEQGMKMAFFTLGNHHDFAVAEVSGEGSTQSESAVGLHHVAFNIGTSTNCEKRS
jgi:catechol-2,3-dioxygenase